MVANFFSGPTPTHAYPFEPVAGSPDRRKEINDKNFKTYTALLTNLKELPSISAFILIANGYKPKDPNKGFTKEELAIELPECLLTTIKSRLSGSSLTSAEDNVVRSLLWLVHNWGEPKPTYFLDLDSQISQSGASSQREIRNQFLQQLKTVKENNYQFAEFMLAHHLSYFLKKEKVPVKSLSYELEQIKNEIKNKFPDLPKKGRRNYLLEKAQQEAESLAEQEVESVDEKTKPLRTQLRKQQILVSYNKLFDKKKALEKKVRERGDDSCSIAQLLNDVVKRNQSQSPNIKLLEVTNLKLKKLLSDFNNIKSDARDLLEELELKIIELYQLNKEEIQRHIYNLSSLSGELKILIEKSDPDFYDLAQDSSEKEIMLNDRVAELLNILARIKTEIITTSRKNQEPIKRQLEEIDEEGDESKEVKPALIKADNKRDSKKPVDLKTSESLMNKFMYFKNALPTVSLATLSTRAQLRLVQYSSRIPQKFMTNQVEGIDARDKGKEKHNDINYVELIEDLQTQFNNLNSENYEVNSVNLKKTLQNYEEQLEAKVWCPKVALLRRFVGIMSIDMNLLLKIQHIQQDIEAFQENSNVEVEKPSNHAAGAMLGSSSDGDEEAAGVIPNGLTK